jgi:hypothetical protein
MLMRFLSSLVIVALVGTVILLASPEAALSQNDPPVSPNPAIYKGELQQAVALTRTNLRDIQALPGDDSAPLPPQLIERCRSAYILIRAARYGMEKAHDRQRYSDPVFELAFKRVDDAWTQLRMPVDGRGMVRNHYISQATANLTSAIRLMDQALMMIP